jgi:hypothetical protein
MFGVAQAWGTSLGVAVHALFPVALLLPRPDHTRSLDVNSFALFERSQIFAKNPYMNHGF